MMVVGGGEVAAIEGFLTIKFFPTLSKKEAKAKKAVFQELVLKCHKAEIRSF